jgi:hypothetical protein
MQGRLGVKPHNQCQCSASVLDELESQAKDYNKIAQATCLD